MVKLPETNNIAVKVANGNSQTGMFRKAEHPTQGMVSVVNIKGKRYLKFDRNFKTDSGPDLFVILYRNGTVPVSGIRAKDYIKLGRLQKINGSQLYAVPKNVNLANYKSVAIWCRQFNATFGYAPLGHQTASISMTNVMAKANLPQGTFQAGEHPTKGVAKIVSENGKSYLELENNFKTDDGPDLYVILHRSDAPPVSGIKEEDYVSLARLQRTNGAQRYEIPENLNLADFHSVAIWCRQFNATFGFAPLS